MDIKKLMAEQDWRSGTRTIAVSSREATVYANGGIALPASQVDGMARWYPEGETRSVKGRHMICLFCEKHTWVNGQPMEAAEHFCPERGKLFAGCPDWRKFDGDLPWLNPENNHTRIDVMGTDAYDEQKKLICEIVVGLKCVCGVECQMFRGADAPTVAERTAD